MGLLTNGPSDNKADPVLYTHLIIALYEYIYIL